MILSHALRTATPKVAPSYTAQYVTAVGSSGTGSSFTFSNVNLGTASSNRIIIVAVASASTSGSQSVTSITVAGLSTTLTASTAGISCVAWGILADDTLTSGTVVVNHSGTRTEGCGIAIYTINGSASKSILDTDYINSAAVTSLSLNTLSTYNPGFVIANLAVNNTITSVTWSGVTSNAVVSGGSGRRFHFASTNTSSITSTYTVSASWSGTAGARLGICSLD